MNITTLTTPSSFSAGYLSDSDSQFQKAHLSRSWGRCTPSPNWKPDTEFSPDVDVLLFGVPVSCDIEAPQHCHVLLMRMLLTYLLTPWCNVLFEKLIVTQIVKKYPVFLWNPNVHYRVHTSPPLDPILSQLNPVRPIDPYLPKVHLNVILPPTPKSSQWSPDFGTPNQNPVNTSTPHACHMSRLPHPP
jgi:hypothetical protein